MKVPFLVRAGEHLNERKGFWVFFAYYCAFILIAGVCSEGWMQADEHFRVLEPAHKFAYGSGSLPWEFSPDLPIVSYLLALIYTPLFLITKALGFSGLHEAMAARALTGLLASTRIIAFSILTKKLPLQKNRGGLYTLLYALCVFTPVYLVRTSQENWSATALLWACVLLVQAFPALAAPLGTKILSAWKSLAGSSPSANSLQVPPSSRRSSAFAAGALLALAFSFRFQVGFCLAGLGLVLLPSLRSKNVLWLIFGGLVGLLPLAIADWATTGAPFRPAINYLLYALGGEEGGQVWGTKPWHEYLVAFFTLWYPPFSIVLGVLLIAGALASPLLAGIFWPFAIVHFILGHKEIRYFSPMLPFMVLACILGWEYFELRFSELLSGPRVIKGLWAAHHLFILCIVATVGWVLVPQNTHPTFVSQLGDRSRKGGPESEFALVLNSRTNLPLFYFQDADKLPQKFDPQEFLNALHKLPPSEQMYNYALEGLELHQIEEAKQYCRVESVSLTRVFRILYGIHPKVPHVKRANAFVQCPLSPESIYKFISKTSEP